ncbi:hypothetical protein H5410_052111 [Solanum commersonii]|uniref:Uncharacterized protein n=1 Tax=Solanum commersonii TaxID=4109 RepID=A0A9J5X2F8_SOLCO|nr:hypothetical protein H5410_052111 [Solanum commersonii]
MLEKYDETITELLGFSFTSIPMKSRTKTTEGQKRRFKGNDQMDNNCCSTQLSDPCPISDSLDALIWDANINIFRFWDNISELDMHDA